MRRRPPAALPLAALLLAACASPPQTGSSGHRTFHVSATQGDDANGGDGAHPFKTIGAAARLAMPGDTILVHAGTYRERVAPARGGSSDDLRITYAAAPGEKAVITGSEAAKGWQKVAGDAWKITLPNAFFGAFNPFAEAVHGDWFDGRGRVHHRGCVYLGDDALPEAANLAAVIGPAGKTPLWFAAVDGPNTVIHARFPGTDPNAAPVEVSVRPTVFTPEKTHIDYITVRGFDLRNAATNWSAPTMGQVGLVSAYWCKGWVIENNEISNSRCSGIALGKYSDAFDGKRGTTEGYYDTIKDAQQKDGWSKDKIGGHLVRGNRIHHCGQNGVVGSLGCAFSRIEGNEIHDINLGTGWSGAEMAGIKFHGAIDTVICDNHIYRCGNTGAIWLDWMAQGTQVTGNLFHDNEGVLADLFTEVDHGPILVANNLFLSSSSLASNTRGICGVHNLAIGRLQVFHDGRRTPFMKPHTTETAGLHDCPAGDYRWFNNVFAGGFRLGACDISVPSLPSVAGGNVYAKGAAPAKFDRDSPVKPDFDVRPKLTRKADGWYLTLAEDPAWKGEDRRKLVTTALLGKAKIPDCAFENADGSPVAVDTDYFGNKRDAANPFPGPFETPVNGEVRVWPK